VLAVGDLHVENFGTWRDAEGRLVWGVNDFDEAARLPYSNDLVRLAASVKVAAEADQLALEFEAACEAILAGYRAAMGGTPCPFVLSENHVWLRDIASGELRDPVHFWAKMSRLTPFSGPVQESGVAALRRALPSADIVFEPLARQAGLGSLGRHRYVAVTEWNGGFVAREAKALCPSAVHWASGAEDPAEILYNVILHGAVRCPDPFLGVQSTWVVRRLAPDCSRIELTAMPKQRDEMRLISAMGRETANIHAGTPEAIPSILKDLDKRPKRWLAEAAQGMVKRTEGDYKDWQKER
jgi:hypothetical protein